jgi:hypothetical protein
MKRTLTLTVCFGLLTLNAWSQSTTASREENLVRTVYAQLSYITQVKVAGEAAMAAYTTGAAIDKTTFNQQLADANVYFTLSDFRTGPISDIASEKWIDIVTQPTPPRDILSIQVSTQDFKDRELPTADWVTATAKWIPGEAIPSAAKEQLYGLSVKEMLALGGKDLMPDGIFLTYAAYTVTVKFQNRSSVYKAAYFFGKNAKGEEKASPQDMLTTFNPPAFSASHTFYPNGLLTTHLRETPVLSQWLDAQKISSNSCVAGKAQLCCYGDRCGVSTEDLHTILATPIPPFPPLKDLVTTSDQK